MIAHVSIGVSGVEKSKRFYDAALEPLGYSCVRAARAAHRTSMTAEKLYQIEQPLGARHWRKSCNCPARKPQRNLSEKGRFMPVTCVTIRAAADTSA
jgi:hypothetical protein